MTTTTITGCADDWNADLAADYVTGTTVSSCALDESFAGFRGICLCWQIQRLISDVSRICRW
jgi:hypothetical protein